MKNKNCLVIIPKHFYFFQNQFKTELENRGFKVIIANDEYPENIWGLLMGKLKIPLTKIFTYSQITNKFLNDKYYSLILIFKGRGLSAKLVDELKLHATKVVGYNWDSFKFNGVPLRWYNKISAYYTFDYNDSEKFNIPLVELFSNVKYIHNKEKKIEYQYSAIFRNHSNRLEYLDKVIHYFKIHNDEIFIYIYEQNIFFALINFFNSPTLYYKYKKFIHSGFLNYECYNKIIENSFYTIDYSHPKQTGLTMRCFDALNVKTNIITNNNYIRKSSYFQNMNPVIFTINNLCKKEEQQLGFETKFPNEWPKRTIEDFFNDLLQ